jgi:hypothetical protein
LGVVARADAEAYHRAGQRRRRARSGQPAIAPTARPAPAPMPPLTARSPQVSPQADRAKAARINAT